MRSVVIGTSTHLAVFTDEYRANFHMVQPNESQICRTKSDSTDLAKQREQARDQVTVPE